MMSDLVMVAVVGAVGSILVALIQRGHKRNSQEHQENAGRLDSILIATGRIEEKIDEHLDNHKEGRA
jgi:hypothetical protein